MSRSERDGSWNKEQHDVNCPGQDGRNNFNGNRSRNTTPFSPVNKQANMNFLKNKSEIFHVIIHEHAAVLCFTEPSDDEVMGGTVNADVEDISNTTDNVSVSGYMSVLVSVSDPSSHDHVLSLVPSRFKVSYTISVTPSQVYYGTTDADPWFPAVFDSGVSVASLVSLVVP